MNDIPSYLNVSLIAEDPYSKMKFEEHEVSSEYTIGKLIFKTKYRSSLVFLC